MAKVFTPLAPNVPIVDEKGNPTSYFQRVLQELQIGSFLTIGTDGNITIGDLTAKTVIGRNSATDGPAQEVTATELLDWIGNAAHGDILYRDSGGWAFLPAGTNGKVLTTHGAGADPTWETPASGTTWGGWTDLTFGAPVSGVVTANETFVLAAGKTLEVEAELTRVENEGQSVLIEVGANHYRIESQSDSNLVIYSDSAAITATGAIGTFEFTGLNKLFFSLSTRSTTSNYMYGIQNDYRFPVTSNASDGSNNMIGTATIKITQNTSGSVLRARARLVG